MNYADKHLTCRDCGQAFTFTVGEQEFHATKGFNNDPSRCQDCRATRSDRAFEFVGAESLPVRGNEARLLQMFEKILQNACDHCAPGGTVRVLADRSDGHARVRIRNPGEPLPADTESLFEPFTSRRSAGLRGEGNLGIGLYVVRQIVRAHGGDVEARSLSSPVGAEFEIRLPLLDS